MTKHANPEWQAKIAAREAVLVEQGFPRGSKVRVLCDANPRIPSSSRFRVGDVGEVLVNLAHGPEKVSVKFDGSGIAHAVDPQNLEVVA